MICLGRERGVSLKRIRLIVLISIIVASVSACDLVQKKPEANADIHWMISAPNSRSPASFTVDKIYRDTILSFEKLHPTIKVTLDYFPEGNEIDTVKLLTGDQSPDIVPAGFNDMESVEKDNLLVDLLSLVSDTSQIDIDNRVLDSVKFHDKLYVLPYSFSPTVVLYNKKLFDDAQIPYPEADWTWEQFRSISKKILPEKGSDIAYDILIFESLLASKGKPIISPDGSTFVGYLDSPEAIEALKWLNAYYHDDPTKTGPRDPTESGIAFNHNAKGMVLSDLQGYTFYKANLGENLGVASLPHFEGGERVNPLYYQGFAISQKSKNAQAAWEFLYYLTFTNQENTVALTENYLTTSKSVGKAIHQDTDPIKSVFANEINYAIRPAGYANSYYFQVLTQELFTQFQDLLQVSDDQLQPKLHDYALKLDEELQRLKKEKLSKS
jgi:multiple sugar transport system substrate-binding protein